MYELVNRRAQSPACLYLIIGPGRDWALSSQTPTLNPLPICRTAFTGPSPPHRVHLCLPSTHAHGARTLHARARHQPAWEAGPLRVSMNPATLARAGSPHFAPPPARAGPFAAPHTLLGPGFAEDVLTLSRPAVCLLGVRAPLNAHPLRVPEPLPRHLPVSAPHFSCGLACCAVACAPSQCSAERLPDWRSCAM